MFILVSGIATLFHQMTEQGGQGGAFIAWLDKHSNHGNWFEIYFWDLIQPFYVYRRCLHAFLSFQKACTGR